MTVGAKPVTSPFGHLADIDSPPELHAAVPGLGDTIHLTLARNAVLKLRDQGEDATSWS